MRHLVRWTTMLVNHVVLKLRPGHWGKRESEEASRSWVEGATERRWVVGRRIRFRLPGSVVAQSLGRAGIGKEGEPEE